MSVVRAACLDRGNEESTRDLASSASLSVNTEHRGASTLISGDLVDAVAADSEAPGHNTVRAEEANLEPLGRFHAFPLSNYRLKQMTLCTAR